MKRLYIKGCMPSPELEDAVLEDGDEIWTLNSEPREGEKPPTRHFSLHGLREEMRCHGREYFVWLSAKAPTVYLWTDQIPLWDEVANESGGALNPPADVRPFPLQEIEHALSPPRTYFTGSFAYMLAYALHLDSFDEVHIVGVSFSDEQLWKSRIRAAGWLREFEERGTIGLPRTREERAERDAELGKLDTLEDYPPEMADHDEACRQRFQRTLNDLRGQGAGDESWARECIMYWSGRLEQAGTRVVTYPESELFGNKWLKTHCKETGSPDCGLYGKCDCIGGE